MKTFKNLLDELSACQEAKIWADDKHVEEVVSTCPRGNWLLWLARKINIDEKLLYLTAGHCANTVRHLMKDKRSTEAVDGAIDYGLGKITIEELRVLKRASAAYAYAASAAAAAYDYAAYAAAASAAAYDYAAAASAAASGDRINNQLETANICRQYIGQAIIDKVNELLKQEVV